MLVVTLYSKKDCPLCRDAREMLSNINEQIPHKVVELDIESDHSLQEKVGESIPVLQVGPYVLKWPFTEQEIRVSLGAASDRQQYYEDAGDNRYHDRIRRGRSISGTDRFSYWLSKKYMWIISILLFVYVGLPFLAPVLMYFNIQGPAKVIYTVYSPLCHQLGFRSVFLFGEQTVYPRALANIANLITYEEITHQDEVDVLAARKYLGDDVVGYKTALCQRDLAIYGSLFLFSFLFMVTGRKIKPVPWYIWVVVGLVPIAFDGFSQLPGIAADIMPSWLPVRESIPTLRYLTGALFGFTTGWYLFPMLEETMRETARMLSRKFSIVQQLEESGETAVVDG